MANLTLELNINSASNLANVNLISKMDVYAVIAINGDDTQEKQKVKTDVDHSGGSNPTWNHAVKFTVNEGLARDGRSTLVMRLISRRVLGNKHIGGVNVPLLELLDSITPSINGDGYREEMTSVTYQVKSPSGKRKGTLNFSYRFKTTPVEPVIPADFPAIDYPPPSGYLSAPPPSQIEHPPHAPPESAIEFCQLSKPRCQIDSDHRKRLVAAGSSFDPLPISYGAGSSPYDKSGYACSSPPKPSHHGYGPYDYAPPSPAGYGYGTPTSQPPKGIGLGLGLGAGLLGGLMMGDLVSDVANCFDL
ncbi:hypothetical protein EUTSA_v10026991mg [Eutrema salsugineum]|uniref:C2 domain-containing protein n=1 Tax=Eutrema salsugineum TaxID=72664 RepID=V4LYY3_EUTSA|nr:protein SRC2 [Eutrema salsugineum]ESQ55905.1 hypothetical protein EUTSA_v10026991mg [Eutrema salsugineum]